MKTVVITGGQGIEELKEIPEVLPTEPDSEITQDEKGILISNSVLTFRLIPESKLTYDQLLAIATKQEDDFILDPEFKHAYSDQLALQQIKKARVHLGDKAITSLDQAISELSIANLGTKSISDLIQKLDGANFNNLDSLLNWMFNFTTRSRINGVNFDNQLILDKFLEKGVTPLTDPLKQTIESLRANQTVTAIGATLSQRDKFTLLRLYLQEISMGLSPSINTQDLNPRSSSTTGEIQAKVLSVLDGL